MLVKNTTLMQSARESLEGKWEIGLLWLIPYTYVTYAKFYDELTSDTLKEIGNPETEEE